MNKYQEAIAIRNAYIQTESGTKCLDDYYKESFDTLQELVDKETPKKFKKILDTSVVCPNCGHHLDKLYGRNYDYCPRCGQKLDWSNNDE